MSETDEVLQPGPELEQAQLDDSASEYVAERLSKAQIHDAGAHS